ncbi:hypothetical protein [Streptomyces sp. NPDC001270]|uniref:hypothetical protein n=1 Tax=Streptomyces sp. NPDC001270 TaxID=3364554 RepID=UPI003674349C
MPSALIIVWAEAVVRDMSCTAVIPCAGMAAADAARWSDITVPDVMRCTAAEEAEPIAAAAVSW